MVSGAVRIELQRLAEVVDREREVALIVEAAALDVVRLRRGRVHQEDIAAARVSGIHNKKKKRKKKNLD